MDYLVPDRVVDGYGLTPPIARRVKERGADVLITVDNGIASVAGVRGLPGAAAYSASKSAVIKLMESLGFKADRKIFWLRLKEA